MKAYTTIYLQRATTGATIVDTPSNFANICYSKEDIMDTISVYIDEYLKKAKEEELSNVSDNG